MNAASVLPADTRPRSAKRLILPISLFFNSLYNMAYILPSSEIRP